MTNQKAMDVLTNFTLSSNGKTILSQLDEYIKAQDKENAIQVTNPHFKWGFARGPPRGL